ncbi:MAG: hypothetical protein IJ446_08445, partial [Oscillospiraceae bacterium]|nr:hypothetical protein [Oscillospiraceae bacterium]
YTLNVSVGTSSTLMSFKYKDTSATISGTNVMIILPEGVDPAAVSAEDCVVEVAAGSSYTFTGTLDAPSDIVVTSSDNISEQTYTLTVIEGSSTKLVSFVIAEQFKANVTISHGTGNENGSIKIIFPEGTDTSKITSNECIVTADTNSVFEFDYDFTKALNSIVVTANTGDVKVYDMTVVTDSAVTIKNFDISIEGASAAVSEDSVEITLPEGTDPAKVTSENCTITLSDGNTYTFEGTLAELTVIRIASAQGLGYKEYAVTVTTESGLLIKSFVIPEEFGANVTITHGEGTADGTIKVIFPEGTVLSDVTCTLTVDEGSVHDFDNVFTEGTNTITVTSNMGKTKIYNMTVIVRSTAVIESLAISGVTADVAIDSTANTVTVNTNSKLDVSAAVFDIKVTDGADYTFDKENMKILVTSKDTVTTKLYTVSFNSCGCVLKVEFSDQTINSSEGGAITITPAEETTDCSGCHIHDEADGYTGTAKRKYVITEIVRTGSKYRYKICARVQYENGEYAYDYAYYTIEA